MRLGDEVNGSVAEEKFAGGGGRPTVAMRGHRAFYPGSTYARSLDDQVRARAAQRLFHPPAIGRGYDARTAERSTPHLPA